MTAVCILAVKIFLQRKFPVSKEIIASFKGVLARTVTASQASGPKEYRPEGLRQGCGGQVML